MFVFEEYLNRRSPYGMWQLTVPWCQCVTVPELTQQMFDAKNMMAACNPRHGRSTLEGAASHRAVLTHPGQKHSYSIIRAPLQVPAQDEAREKTHLIATRWLCRVDERKT
jgi:hypothetical protein